MYALYLNNEKRVYSILPASIAIGQNAIARNLPDGDFHDYLFINGSYVYDPLPIPPEPDPEPTPEDRLEAQVLYTAMMTDTLLED